jgi:uroporphyrin-3 C-methyltransferase
MGNKMTEPTSSNNHHTDDKSTAEKVNEAAAKAVKQANLAKSSTASTNKKSVEPAPVSKNNAGKNNTKTNEKQRVSKLAIVAIIIALLAIAAVVSQFYIEQEKQNQQTLAQAAKFKQLQQQNAEQLQQIKQQFSAQLNAFQQAQQSAIAEQTVESKKQLTQQLTEQLAEFSAEIKQLSEHQPSDWIASEVNYLIRLAARSLWLEKNAQTAINLLKEANQRLSKLQNPQYLPLRAAINDDIETLQLLPEVDAEQLILSIQALAKQVTHLPLNQVQLPDDETKTQDLTLTNNIADWRSNLAKVWQRFLNQFITVRRRSGNVEPLMAPKYQQHLSQNIMLKLQQAAWAVSQQKPRLYQATMTEISTWITEYYDVNEQATQQFLARINALAQQPVAVDLPQQLQAVMISEQLANSDRKLPASNNVESNNSHTEQVPTEIKNAPNTQTNLDEGNL